MQIQVSSLHSFFFLEINYLHFKISTLMSGIAFGDYPSAMKPEYDEAGETEEQAGKKQWQKNGPSRSSPEMIAISFAEDRKAQSAARALFELVHAHGDNLREVMNPNYYHFSYQIIFLELEECFGLSNPSTLGQYASDTTYSSGGLFRSKRFNINTHS
jgi:hypothetical protein